MRLYHRKRDQQDSKDYYVKFDDQLKIERHLRLFPDKASSQTTADNIERLINFKCASRALDSGLLTFIEGLLPRIRKKLTEWGILDQAQNAAGENIVELINRCGANMRGLQRDENHCRDTISMVKKLCAECNFHSLTTIKTETIINFMSQLAAQKLSPRRINGYIIAGKYFVNWCKHEGMIAHNPFDTIKLLNENIDRRYIRRVFTDNESERLLTTTLHGVDHHGLNGFARTLVYRLGIEVGFRFGDVYTIPRRAFNFSGATAYVAIEKQKNNKVDILPIKPALAKDLQRYFAENLALPDVPAFFGLSKDCGAEMLRRDLEAAGIEIENNDGKLDFHALRHTFGTRHAKAGTPPAVLQKLMRHSSIELTMKYYVHLRLEDTASAVMALPDVMSTPTVNLAMTGTDGNLIPETYLKKMDSKMDSFLGKDEVFLGQMGETAVVDFSAVEILKNTIKPVFLRDKRNGGESVI